MNAIHAIGSAGYFICAEVPAAAGSALLSLFKSTIQGVGYVIQRTFEVGRAFVQVFGYSPILAISALILFFIGR